jgi:hypothetical protein
VIRALVFISACLAAGGALAQAVTSGSSTTTTARGGVNPQLVQLLRDGYEIKAAFAEAGVPYVMLQKTTSAYLCRGSGSNVCEKLN